MNVINYLTRIIFDFGASSQLGSELMKLNVKRPMIVTDMGLVELGLLEEILGSQCESIDSVLYSDAKPNPSDSDVEVALQYFKESDADGLVSIGGGSSIDLAKAVALMATHDGTILSYAAVHGGMDNIGCDVIPHIAIPTTAGTGSEVGRSTIICQTDGCKIAVASQYLIPKVALCDPSLTIKMPPHLTAATGMDALTHCIETYLSRAINPPGNAIALDGFQRGYKSIVKAVDDGSDQDARWEMMMSALEGAMVFQKGLGAVHALSHAIGGLNDGKLHHGTLNAIFLPHVLKFNEAHVGEKYKLLLNSVSNSDSSEYFPKFIEQLVNSLDIPRRLRDLNINIEVFEDIAEKAENDFTSGTNPRQATASDYLRILYEAY